MSVESFELDRAAFLPTLAEMGDPDAERILRIQQLITHYGNEELPSLESRAKIAAVRDGIAGNDADFAQALDDFGALRAPVRLPNEVMGRFYLNSLAGLIQRGAIKVASVYGYDVANFGTINEALGEQYGDDILKLIGKSLQRVVRPYDSVVSNPRGDDFRLFAISGRDDFPLTGLAIALRAFHSPAMRMLVPEVLPQLPEYSKKLDAMGNTQAGQTIGVSMSSLLIDEALIDDCDHLLYDYVDGRTDPKVHKTGKIAMEYVESPEEAGSKLTTGFSNVFKARFTGITQVVSYRGTTVRMPYDAEPNDVIVRLRQETSA